jgi:hypothetical protein
MVMFMAMDMDKSMVMTVTVTVIIIMITVSIIYLHGVRRMTTCWLGFWDGINYKAHLLIVLQGQLA